MKISKYYQAACFWHISESQ